MIKLTFTEDDIKVLHYERFHHPHPRVQRKMEALYLKSQGLPHQDICRLAGLSPNTLRRYLRQYQKGGIEGLKQINFYRPESELNRYADRLEAYFREHPPATIKEAQAKIEELTSLRRSLGRVRLFLKSIGLRRRKVASVPAKADPEEQERFKKKELEPRLEQAEEGKRAVFFVDAAHFVLSPFLGFLWCFSRVFIKAPSGRKRFNVLGALNAITHELLSVTNDRYINARGVCDLLWKLEGLKLRVPMTLVLDNARYQKCAVVQELASLLEIELLYLPTYSPHLNLIERLWKFVKKQCLYSKYYADFASFKGAISACLDQTSTTHKQELETLLSLRFQTLPKAQVVTA